MVSLIIDLHVFHKHQPLSTFVKFSTLTLHLEDRETEMICKDEDVDS